MDNNWLKIAAIVVVAVIIIRAMSNHRKEKVAAAPEIKQSDPALGGKKSMLEVAPKQIEGAGASTSKPRLPPRPAKACPVGQRWQFFGSGGQGGYWECKA